MRLALITFIVLFFSHLGIAMAESEPKVAMPNLEIDHVWAKPNYGPNGAAYFELTNKGDKPLYLIDATSSLSKRVELHTHIKQDGVMKMRKVKEPIEIAPGKTVTFAPAGYHVMLFAMEKKLKDGDKLPLTLIFKDGSKRSLMAKVQKDHASKPDHHGHHH